MVRQHDDERREETWWVDGWMDDLWGQVGKQVGDALLVDKRILPVESYHRSS
jgi:hypothetical protein